MIDKVIFNNREIAIFLLLTIGLLWAITNKKFRMSIWGFIKALFKWKLLISIMLMVLYVGLLTLILYKFGLWDLSLLKDTIYWFVGGAFVLYVNVYSDSDKDDYFRRLIINNLSVLVVLEFVSNLYSFNLLIELATLFLIFGISLLKAFSDNFKVDKKVIRFIDFILFAYGFGIISFTVYHIFIDPRGFFSLGNINSLLLPFVFTILFLPWLYISALFMIYGLEFMRIGHMLRDDKQRVRAFKWLIVIACKFDLRKIKLVSKELNIFMIKDAKHLRSKLSSIIKK